MDWKAYEDRQPVFLKHRVFVSASRAGILLAWKSYSRIAHDDFYLFLRTPDGLLDVRTSDIRSWRVPARDCSWPAMGGDHQGRGDAWWARVTPQELSLDALTEFVADPGAGAISTFIGVTRDNFNGKSVVKLEYEAYEPMAVKKLSEVCREALSKYSISKVAVGHRTGTVRVGEASVIIATSSPHRKDAIEACHWVIDTLKATVPIWKKEYFLDGEVWKENAESRLHLQQS